MISIGRSVGQPIEIAYDLLTDRVCLIIASTRYLAWLTDGEAERLADSLVFAAGELRRRRGERR